jgi:hypothetical protein
LPLRYHPSRRFGLKVRIEERLVVPWDETEFFTQVKELLSEGEPVHLQDHGTINLQLV